MANIFVDENILYELNLNNNCLINKFDTNRKVLNFNYTASTYTFTNTLALTNANNNNTLLLAYIIIPDDAYYKFRVRSNTNLYSGVCKIYLNNWQNVILDKTTTSTSNSDSAYEIIKKGVYLLCIDIPKTNTTTTITQFNIVFDKQNNGSTHPILLSPNTWTNIDTLLFTDCNTVLSNDPVGVINNFFRNTADYCSKDNNINSLECTNFYLNNEIDNKIVDYTKKIQSNNIYPNTVIGYKTGWSISDSDWSTATSSQLAAIKDNPTAFGSCGKSATRTRTKTIYPTKYDINSSNYNPTTTSLESESQTLDVNCYTNQWIADKWRTYADTTTIPKGITDLQFDSDITKINAEFEKYSTTNLISKLTLYGDNSFLSTTHSDWITDTVSNFEVANNSLFTERGYIYPNILYSYGYTWTSRDTNGITLTIQDDGDLVCKSGTTVVWRTRTGGNAGAKLCITRNKNLKIYSASKTELWSFDMGHAFEVASDVGYIFTGNTLRALKSSANLYGHQKAMFGGFYYYGGFALFSDDDTSKLAMQTDGNLVLYKGNAVWSSGTFGYTNAYCGLLSNGNLCVYDSNNNQIWNSGTTDTNCQFVRVLNSGYVVIERNEKVERAYPENYITFNYIRSHLKDTHWLGSPWTLFSDKKGRVFKATWSTLDKSFEIGSDGALNSSLSQAGCSAADKDSYCPFRGWRFDENNSQWNVTERDMKNKDNYDTQLSEAKPVVKSDSDEYNYRSSGDRSNFNGDQSKNRKPPQLSGGIEKPNFIPGYVRMSYTNGSGFNNTFNFLVATRCGSCRDQAFVAYQIMRDRDKYANSIIANNTELIQNIINDDYVLKEAGKILSINIDNMSDNLKKRIRDKLKDMNNGSNFTNKSQFSNNNVGLKSNFENNLNLAIKSNFENNYCDIQNISTDPNCTGDLFNAYKGYINNMDKYCQKNALVNICSDYIDKKFQTSDGTIVSPNVSSKLILLSQQEALCDNAEKLLDSRCVALNSKKPDILQKYVGSLDKNSDTYKSLTKSYGDELNFQFCISGSNIINNPDICSKLESNLTYADKIQTKKNTLCIEDANIVNSECVKHNKKNETQLNIVKDNCTSNKTNNCKKLCSEYKDEFSDICFWENNKLYFILFIIIAIVIGGLYLKYKKPNPASQSMMQQPMMQQPMMQQPMVQQPMMQQPMVQQPMMQQPMMQQPMMQQPMMPRYM